MANWHDEVFFGIHYDLHAGEKDTELGRELTPAHLREMLARVAPDWIQCDCKGHPGWTSYPTKVGSASPGIVKDALRIHRDVTREMGIRLGVHYSGIMDARAMELHPEWSRLEADGKPAGRGCACLLGGYPAGLMVPQLLEIVDEYDVDGFWVDGENWAAEPCWCERCRAEFTRRTGVDEIPLPPGRGVSAGDAGWDAWLAFHRALFTEYVTVYATAVHERKPGCLVCSNWAYTVRQPDPVEAPVDYLSGDYTPDWGAARAALEGRLLDGRAHGATASGEGDRFGGISWDLMAWGFTHGGFSGKGRGLWCMKNATHLCQEVSEVVALGGAVMVYAKPERTGRLVPWHHDVLAEVADFCRARKDVCFRSRTVPQAAVLHLAPHYYALNAPLFNYGDAVAPVEGALCALLETHRSTDVLTEEAALVRIREYGLVVVPEQTRLSREVVSALEEYAREGGHVVMSGAHLARECPDLVGAEVKGEAETYEGGRRMDLAAGDGAVGLPGPWQPVSPRTGAGEGDGTEAVAYALRSQDPGDPDLERPVITRRRLGRGTVTAIHGPLFAAYAARRFPPTRRLIGDLVAALPVEWAVEVEAPPWLEVILRQQDGRLMVNLVNRGSGEALSPERVMVEKLAPVEDVRLSVVAPEEPKSVSLVPSGAPVEWSWDEGRVSVRVPSVPVHEIVVIKA